MDDMQTIAIPGTGNFQFSAVKLENLGATEYTLVTIAIDISSSVDPFADELLKSLKSIVESCKKSPRAENLMVRLITFNQEIQEIHGFKLLNQINVNDYKDLNPLGLTALYDATYSAIGAMTTYAKNLTEQEFGVNGAIFIVTDGMDNRSVMKPHHIAEKLKEGIAEEYIESHISCLVGLKDPSLHWNDDIIKYLNKFKEEADLTEFLDVGDATPKKLAKLANWVSSSISSQSQALGTGGPSQQLTF